MSHLAFADDLILFTKGSKVGLKKIMGFFKHYEQASCQKINMSKSDVFIGKEANSVLVEGITGLSVKPLPFYYFGSPIAKGRKKKDLYIPLIEKIRRKLSGRSSQCFPGISSRKTSLRI